jgi:hypothetical protein
VGRYSNRKIECSSRATSVLGIVILSFLGGGMETDTAVIRLEKNLGKKWIHLEAGRRTAIGKITELERTVGGLANEESSIVVFGSLARGEFTAESDIDWTLLLDGRADSSHLDVVHRVESAIGDHKPGPEGTFGGLAFSHEIIHNIGGSCDTNKNITQRILLLLESDTIGAKLAHERVIKQVLTRYISEDWGLTNQKRKIPRFLLNDIVRYWRTIAVDYGYKRRHRKADGWALRSVKLRMSRKLIYVSGLLACFSCHLDPRFNTELASKKPKDVIPFYVNYMYNLMKLSPLEIVADFVLRYDSNKAVELYKIADCFFDSYDSFLGLLANKETRDTLKSVPYKNPDQNAVYVNAQKICKAFQDCLENLFFEENGTNLFKLVKTHGVF